MSLVLLCAPLRGRADDAAIADRLVELRAAVLDPARCPDTRICPLALRSIDRASGILAGADITPARMFQALALSSAALAMLERAQLAGGALEPSIAALAAAVQDRVDEVQDQADGLVEDLCSSVRLAGGRLSTAAGVTEAAAANAILQKRWSLGLRLLGTALLRYRAAVTVAQQLGTRCQPPACRFAGAPGFTPGDPANDSIELIAADLGTQLDYDFEVSEDLLGIPAEGELRISFLGLSVLRYRGQLEMPLLSLPVNVLGTTRSTACTDAAGWARVSSVTDTVGLFSREIGGARLLINVRLDPPAVGLLASLFPLPPRALVLRVGDRIEQNGLQLAGVIVPGGALREECDVVHEVAAIEDVTVPAGTYRAARVESQSSCRAIGGLGTEEMQVSTWLVSRIGQVKAEVRESGQPMINMDLSCAEFPETRGACGAL